MGAQERLEELAALAYELVEMYQDQRERVIAEYSSDMAGDFRRLEAILKAYERKIERLSGVRPPARRSAVPSWSETD